MSNAAYGAMCVVGAVVLVIGLILHHIEKCRGWKMPVWVVTLLLGFFSFTLMLFFWCHLPTTVPYRGGSLPAGQYQICAPECGRMLLLSREKVPPKDFDIFVYYFERGQDVEIIWVEDGDPKAFTFEVRRRSPTAEWAGLEMKAYLPGYLSYSQSKTIERRTIR